MAEKSGKPTIHIELTEQQKEQIRQLTGKAVTALELTAEELEERIAPAGGACQIPSCRRPL